MLTLFNAFKPVTMDDPSYLQHAQRFASQPLDPYGGEMFLYQTWGPALHNNAPPVSIYWLALGRRLLGESEFAWKLWLLPWALVLGLALRSLLARWAPGLERPVVWMTLLSPAVLPGFDFMLDIPALALIVAAVAVAAHAFERGSVAGALAAGLVAGLAMQTKYTGVTAPAAILVLGVVLRRPGLALLACGAACVVVVGTEALLYERYGDSPLLYYIGRRTRGASGDPRLALLMPLIRTGGLLGAALVPLGLVALGASLRTMLLTAAGIATAVLAFAFLPGGMVARLDGISGGRFLNFENLTLGLVVAVTIVVLVAAGRRAVAKREAVDLVLLSWLAIEIVGYFAVSTAPAARRVFGALTVTTLFVARAASIHLKRAPARRPLAWLAAALGVCAGVALWVVDRDDALAQRADVGRVIAVAGGTMASAAGTIWYVGNHFGGFQFYAPRAGLHPAITGRSAMAAGDWLVVPLFVQEKRVQIDRGALEPVTTLAPVFGLPITTRHAFQGGDTPIRRPDPTWTAATVYRVVRNGIVVQKDLRPR